MAIFGGYETVHEVHRHALGAILRARATHDGADPKFIVKAFQPSSRIAGREAMQPAIRTFLDGVRIQQDVASSGADHWAPVYEAGVVGRSGYYVTAYYARSAEKLIYGRAKLSADALHVIVNSVLQGLLELKRLSNRTHGNLKPSNILLDGEEDLEHTNVFLADPAPTEQLPPEGAEPSDLVSIGELICQLVLHRLPRGAQSWPIPRSPEWSRLGRVGDTWRTMCNELLKPDGNSGLTLEQVAARVQKLRRRKRVITPARVLSALAVILLVGGWLATAAYLRLQSDWIELCRKYDQWVYPFQREVKEQPERLARFQSDPYIKAATQEILAEGAGLDPKAISGNQMLTVSAQAQHAPLSLKAFSQVRSAVEKIRRAEVALSRERWPLLRELREYQSRYQQRGWEPSAKYLQQIIDRTQPGSSDNVAAAVDHLLTTQAKLREDLLEIEGRWEAMNAATKVIKQKAGDDKILRQFEAFEWRHIQRHTGSGPESASIEHLRAAIAPVADLAQRIADIVDTDWPGKIDQQRFTKESDLYRITAEPGKTEYGQWLKEVQDYYRYRPDLTQTLAGLNQSAQGVAGEIASRKAQSLPMAPLEQKLEATKADISGLSKQSWVQKDRRTGAIDQVAADLRKRLDALRDEVLRQKPVVARKVDIVQELMAAANPKPAFKLNLATQFYKSSFGDRCISLTITPDRDCYLLVLCRDAAGEIVVLLPNAKKPRAPLAPRGQPLRIEEMGIELTIQPPYGKTVFKVIASSRRINFAEAKANAQTLMLEHIQGLTVEGDDRVGQSVSDLLKPDEWTAGEVEVVTRQSDKDEANDGRHSPRNVGAAGNQ